jgi:hypothetical protein
MDFTNGNILSVFTEGITVEKKIKTKQKKFLVNCEHYSLCQLQRESPTETSIGILQRALELFTFQLHCKLLFFTDKITDGLKSRRCYLAVF